VLEPALWHTKVGFKSSASSPAPPSLVPGYFGLVDTVAAIVPFPPLTIFGLDRRNGIYRWLVSELQPPPLAL
jgi:hypothetical protein